VRLHRPIGILLLLWPTLWALLIAAHGEPDGYTLFAFVAGTVLMRSAGCAINDFADRDFDRHVRRTCDRPLTAGLIAPWEAMALFIVLTLASAVLILPMNRMTWLLALAAVFLAATYPFTKRFLAVPQAYLGIAFGFGIPMSYAALTGSIPMEAWVLLVANMFWAIAYDTEYALVDREDDLKIGIKTSAITFGRFDIAAIALCYAAALVLLGWVGSRLALGAAYFGGLLIAAGIAGYHLVLIRRRDPEKCFRAFLHNTWFGAAVFGGIVLDYLVQGA